VTHWNLPWTRLVKWSSGALIVTTVIAATALSACRERDAAPPPSAAAKPLDVATAIASCTDLADCNRRCQEENPNACVSAGRLYEFGHGVPRDAAAAFPLYEKACDLKYAGGCYNAAVLLETGKGVEKDVERARALYAKVCGLGGATACERAEKLGAVPPAH
jgi:TPR repeat protein